MNDDPTVRNITLDANGLPLSGSVAEAAAPRGVVVALHGAGMSSGYFNGRAHPSQSFMELAAASGWTVLALDRPGYRVSARWLPEGQPLTEQAEYVRAALDHFAEHNPVGSGFFVLGHSYGSMVALTMAASSRGRELLGLDLSGCGYRYAVDPRRLSSPRHQRNWRMNWGKLSFYPPGSFRFSESLVSNVPEQELRDAVSWTDHFRRIAGEVRVPVRFTFAEYEHWWRHGGAETHELTKLLTSARPTVHQQRYAGHNISLGWAARSYHSRVLAFAEQCLLETDAELAVTAVG